MPGHIDAVLGKLLAVGGGGGGNSRVSAAALATSRLLRTKLFRPHKVKGYENEFEGKEGWVVRFNYLLSSAFRKQDSSVKDRRRSSPEYQGEVGIPDVHTTQLRKRTVCRQGREDEAATASK